MSIASVDVKVTTPLVYGGYSPEKKMEYLQDMHRMMGDIVGALEKDFQDASKEMTLLEETNEDLARQLYEEKMKGGQKDAAPEL